MSLVHVTGSYLDFANRYFASGRGSIPDVLRSYNTYRLMDWLEMLGMYNPSFYVRMVKNTIVHVRDRLNIFQLGIEPVEKPNDRARSQSWTDPRVQMALRERGRK